MSTHAVAFALRSTQSLLKITSDDSHFKRDNEARRYLRALSAALLNASETLKVMPLPLDVTVLLEVLSLLATLEELCQWPIAPGHRPAPGKVPNLSYPNLSTLQRTSAKATRSILAMASQAMPPLGTSNDKIDFLEALKKFGRPVPVTTRTWDTDLTAGAAVLRPEWLQEDHNSAASCLYHALCQYCYCSNQQIGVKLRLTVEKSRDSEDPTFHVLFAIHPHPHTPTANDHWQITTIALAAPDSPAAARGTASHAVIQHDQFCPQVCYTKRAPINLVLHSNFLHLADDRHGQRLWITTRPSISLRAILESNYQVEKAPRYLLMFMLAKALWQFHGTDWMRVPWTTDNVQFLVEHRRHATGVFLNEPFISARFNPGKRSTAGALSPPPGDGPSAREQAQIIEAFGVMLLELEMGVSMRSEARTLPEYDEIKTDDEHYQQVFTARRLIGDAARMNNVFPRVEKVVRSCVFPDELQEYYKESGGLRMAVYRTIIAPIVELVKLQYRSPESIVLHRPTIPDDPVSNQNIYEPAWDGTSSGRQPLTSISAGKPITYAETPISEHWFGEMSKLNSVLQAPTDRNHPMLHTRIVILDTGIRSSSRFSRAIVGYKDFVSGKDEVKTDNTGHGTRAVELLFKVFSEAKVFVGRVFETNEQSENTQDLMAEVHKSPGLRTSPPPIRLPPRAHFAARRFALSADIFPVLPPVLPFQAIRWAYKDCQADIISMASGFRDDHRGMASAIGEANQAGALVFAAASNYGGIRRVTFPARLRYQVFCVFMTDAKANVAGKSASLNPPPRRRSANFAVLGEDIHLADALLGREPPVDGTSYATSIAAGVAGRLVHFSRQPGPAGRIRNVEDLRTFAGMESVLLTMVHKSGGYDCIAPWSLLENTPSETKREALRDRICETISRALEAKDD